MMEHRRRLSGGLILIAVLIWAFDISHPASAVTVGEKWVEDSLRTAPPAGWDDFRIVEHSYPHSAGHLFHRCFVQAHLYNDRYLYYSNCPEASTDDAVKDLATLGPDWLFTVRHVSHAALISLPVQVSPEHPDMVVYDDFYLREITLSFVDPATDPFQTNNVSRLDFDRENVYVAQLFQASDLRKEMRSDEVVSVFLPILYEAEVHLHGAHRELFVRLYHSEKELAKSSIQMTFFIDENFYIDEYQLSELQRMSDNSFEFVVWSGAVDVEKPSAQSPSHLVTFTLKPDLTALPQDSHFRNLTFPLHLRYQKPSSDSAMTHRSAFLNTPRFTLDLYNYYTVDVSSSVPLSFENPVGMTADGPLVLSLTSIVSVFGSLVLVAAMWCCAPRKGDARKKEE